MIADIEYLTCAETARLLRQALRAAFPDVRFRVRSKTYSGGASITISWIDGPVPAAVERIARRFEGAEFDGMHDLKTYHTSELDGRTVQFGADFVFCERSLSAGARRQVVAEIEARYGGTWSPNRNYGAVGGVLWGSDLFHQVANTMAF